MATPQIACWFSKHLFATCNVASTQPPITMLTDNFLHMIHFPAPSLSLLSLNFEPFMCKKLHLDDHFYSLQFHLNIHIK